MKYDRETPVIRDLRRVCVKLGGTLSHSRQSNYVGIPYGRLARESIAFGLTRGGWGGLSRALKLKLDLMTAYAREEPPHAASSDPDAPSLGAQNFSGAR